MMLETNHLLLLSVIQGITEFLPISSSGHLVLVPSLTGAQDQGQLLDVAAHFGTLGAVIIYMRADILRMARGMLSLVTPHKDKDNTDGLALALLIALASVPVIFVGLIIELLEPAFLRLVLTVALANLVFAGALYHADKSYPATRELADITARDAIAIGIAQIFALIPGTSRSGVTMTAARRRSFTRIASARFSLLLSLPVIIGATILKSRHFFTYEAGSLTLMFDAAQAQEAGLVASLSFVTALAAIYGLMRWIAKADFAIFVYYRICLGIILLGALWLGYL